MRRAYFSRIGTTLSQTLNVVVFNGDPDESLSARCYRNREKKRYEIAKNVIDTILFFQPDHCHKSYLIDIEHAKNVLRDDN